MTVVKPLVDSRLSLATGVELDVTTGGDGDPVIFLHGFPESRRTWRHQVADLAADHRVVAPDQRGYAHSSKPESVDAYTQEELSADVIALADALGMDRFTLVGHDFGGIVAWSTATKYPDRVSRLVIANAPHPMVWQRTVVEDPEQRAHSQYITMFQQDETPGNIAAMGFETFFDTRLMAMMDPTKVTPEDREAAVAALSVPGAFRAMCSWYRAIGIIVPEVGADAGVPEWAAEPIPRLSMPVLVLWGDDDRALRPSQLEGIAEVVEDLTLVRLPGVGHFSPWEAPSETTAAIRKFLRDHDA